MSSRILCVFPVGASGKNSSTDAGDIRDEGLIPGSGRYPGGGNDNPPQYSCLENSMDRGAWWAVCSPQDHRVGHTEVI